MVSLKPALHVALLKINSCKINEEHFGICNQEKIREQKGRLQVQALGYINSTKVIFGDTTKSFDLEQKSVFREVPIKANLDLMF